MYRLFNFVVIIILYRLDLIGLLKYEIFGYVNDLYYFI